LITLPIQAAVRIGNSGRGVLNRVTFDSGAATVGYRKIAGKSGRELCASAKAIVKRVGYAVQIAEPYAIERGYSSPAGRADRQECRDDTGGY
jgi:hypothetical protein